MCSLCLSLLLRYVNDQYNIITEATLDLSITYIIASSTSGDPRTIINPLLHVRVRVDQISSIVCLCMHDIHFPECSNQPVVTVVLLFILDLAN